MFAAPSGSPQNISLASLTEALEVSWTVSLFKLGAFVAHFLFPKLIYIFISIFMKEFAEV